MNKMIYQCICCGEKREGTKNSSCLKCGYPMFEFPFDRKSLLTDEIKKFFLALTQTELKKNQLGYFRKGKSKGEQSKIILKKADDERFPSFETIVDYVCSAEKTEIFFERAKNTVQKVKKHISTPFQEEYQVDSSAYASQIRKKEEVMTTTLRIIKEDIYLDELRLPELTLTYSETPDGVLLGIAIELLDDSLALLEKAFRFIKSNNIYGNMHQKDIDLKSINWKKNESQRANLENAKLSINEVLGKKYDIGIFSDGTSELKEMYQAFFEGLHAILSSHILTPTYVYKKKSNGAVSNSPKQFYNEYLSNRYAPYIDKINNHRFTTHTEGELFDIYNQLIEKDNHNILMENKSQRLKIGKTEQELNSLIGLASIKESIKKIKAYSLANKNNSNLNLHMCFYGNPGTGKTEVARLIAGILYENNILPTNTVIEVQRRDLIGEYMGQTPEKTMAKIKQSMGGVLFIDEAYSLVPEDGSSDYGHEAVATLVKAMEDYRGKFCVILAGYKNKLKKMIATNPGFKSRIQFELDFPNYSREELKSIAELMIQKRNYSIGPFAFEKILDITDVKRKDPNFANAREMRNLLDQVIMCQNLRVLDAEDREIGIADVNKYISDSKIILPSSGNGFVKTILSAEAELEELVGLDSVKRMVKKIKAYAKRNKDDLAFNMHMCFSGNPGTGKTEVARILSRLLYEAGVLEEAKLVETDASGLLGRYVGETAPKTHEKVQSAMGGVLFIDEAYSLTENGDGKRGSSFGDEAITALIKDMEDFRGRFCVILAGYKEEMNNMIGKNPGLKSRIQFSLEFPDYTKEELREIAIHFATKRKYVFDDDALSKFLDVIEFFRRLPNFANARTVRKVLDQVIMNQNLRVDDSGVDDNTLLLSDIEEYIVDEKIDFSKSTTKRPIGF